MTVDPGWIEFQPNNDDDIRRVAQEVNVRRAAANDATLATLDEELEDYFLERPEDDA